MKAAAVLVALAFVLAGTVSLAQDAPGGKPVPKQDETEARIKKLVEQLGAEAYKDREEATEELKKIGEPAAAALRKALESEDAEVRWRAESILKGIVKKDARSKNDRPMRADPRQGPGLATGAASRLVRILGHGGPGGREQPVHGDRVVGVVEDRERPHDLATVVGGDRESLEWLPHPLLEGVDA